MGYLLDKKNKIFMIMSTSNLKTELSRKLPIKIRRERTSLYLFNTFIIGGDKKRGTVARF